MPRRALVAAFACLPLVALAQDAGWRANPELVARLSPRRPDTNYDEARVKAYTLPDLLAPGPAATRERWTARREEILQLLRNTADRGQAIAMVTHDLKTASYADRIVRLVDGEIVDESTL